MRPTSQEATAIGKLVCYSQFLRGGAGHTLQSLTGKYQVGHKAEGVMGKYRQSLYCGFHGRKKINLGMEIIVLQWV